MKKFIALLLLLAAAASAQAAVKEIDGGFFTLRVWVNPATRAGKDWTLTQHSETSASVTPPDKSFVLSVSVFDSSASSLKDLAASLAQTHGARELTKMAGEGEAYEYVGSSSGLPLYAQTFDLGAGRAGYIAILGDYESGAAAGAFNSVRFVAPETQEKKLKGTLVK